MTSDNLPYLGQPPFLEAEALEAQGQRARRPHHLRAALRIAPAAARVAVVLLAAKGAPSVSDGRVR